MGPLIIKASIQIAKPAHEVYEAIVDPKKMSGYFIATGSGRMEEGQTLTWKFPEFSEELDVFVTQSNPDQQVTFEWQGSPKQRTTTNITLSAGKNGSTLVKITESEMPANEDGITWLRQNTEGWANFLACLKAYLEYNINLRKGAFDFMTA
ncbi:SRPBCC domain-containing protein [Chitinophaga sp. HK235]|uniref:SRPBCC domain-containing protein n=1 Tax=Chitinophaga sp. HK235 TaxID=2952571 RepID=UPI001BAC6657|nr:SRPBCC domain-containing protein [Chitinophaga sp. HK235]